MGAGGSVRANEMNRDPWWPLHSSQHAHSNMLEQRGPSHISTEDESNKTVGEEKWLKQIQDLGKVIHNLAGENIQLLDMNKELKQQCEEQEEMLKGRDNNLVQKETEPKEDLQIVTCLQEEATNSKKLIEDLKQQLQVNTENSALEVEKYHENLCFMQMKVREYEQVVEKLEKDAAVQKDAFHTLQSIIMCTEDQEKETEESTVCIKMSFEKLKQKHRDCQEENKSLQEQIETERKMKRKTNEENQKLLEELEQIKQQLHLNTVKTHENTAVDLSENNINRSGDQFPTGSDSVGNEEARALSPRAAAEIEVFQKQLRVKREARHKALSAISMEMERLRRELNAEREVRKNAVRELENTRKVSEAHHVSEEINDLKFKLSNERDQKDKLYKEMIDIQKNGNEEIEGILKELEKEKARTQQALEENKFIKEQLEESDNMLQLRIQENNELQNKLETDRGKYQQQVLALKDVVTISKEMLTVRENQVTHLKQTLQDIEATVIQKNHGSLTAGLRAEYETQMENIKALKTLYEERTHVMNAEKERLISEQKELQKLIENEKRAKESLEVQLKDKEDTISERNATVSDLQDQLSDAIDQSRNLSYELTLINNMFTQILGSTDMDLDRLTKLLQENHDLITEITTKSDCSETTASLPKMLLDLVCHAENAESNSSERKHQDTDDNISNDASCEEACAVNGERDEAVVNINPGGSHLAMQDISSNLPKVWKVLLELVSHHIPSSTGEASEDSKTSCYKSIDTPYGPKDVISVSKTFIRLRDLILQKKSLQKEVTRLKQLNIHLETKLSDQERRLSLVSTELRKTWNVVDHMRVQHQQLHTHEKVLRYELQQKRKLLTELKEELEYCREKWEDARQMNSQSESEWQKLRKEFALRKNKPLNNSGESGFSEEKDEDSPDSDITKAQGQLCQIKCTSDGLNNLHHAVCTSQTIMNHDDTEAVNSSTSLPDLVSVAADIPLPSSDEGSIGTILSNEVSTVVSTEDSMSHLQNIVQETLSIENGNNDPAILEHTVFEECLTVSLITLLKQQLSNFSRNLEMITAGFDANDHFQALQSIFSLPAIQIPEHLNNITGESSSSYLQINCTSDSANRKAIDQGIQCTENCHDHQRDDSPEEKVSQNYSGSSAAALLEQENVVKTLSPSSSQAFYADRQENESTEEPNRIDRTDVHSNESSLEESKSERMHRLQRQCQQLFDKVVSGKSYSTSNTTEPTERKEQPKPQNDSTQSTRESTRGLEDILDARAVRLKRLEEQSQQLFKKVKRTTNRSVELANRLEELHEQYGSEDTITSETFPRNEITNSPNSSTLPNVSASPSDHTLPLSMPNNVHHTPTSFSVPSSSTHNPHSQPPQDVLDALSQRLEDPPQQQHSKVHEHPAELSNLLVDMHEQCNRDDAKGGEVSVSTSDSSPLNIIPKPPPFPLHLLTSVSQELDKSHARHTSTPTSLSTNISAVPPSLEDVLDARAARLQRLEEQSQQLYKKVKRTTHRSAELSNRLEELHEQYGNDNTHMNVTSSCSNTTVVFSSSPVCQSENSQSHLTLNYIPSPPPLPPALPSVRLPTEIDNPNVRCNNFSTQDTNDDAKEER